MNNKGFSKIEILFIIVILAILTICGATVVTITTREKKQETLIENATEIVSGAKQAFANYIKQDKSDYIVVSDDGVGKGMCITLDGLHANGFTEKTYNDYDGYVVIEEINNAYYYSLWLTDKEYTIDGYESKKIPELTIEDGTITKYSDETYSSRVRTSFTGTTSTKGGSGQESQTKRYQTKCISEKIE